MSSFFPSEKHSSNQLSRIVLSLLLLFASFTAFGQVIIGFQGGEPGDSWPFTATAASSLAQSEANLGPNKVTGTRSLVVGGTTGGGNCFAGTTGTGTATAHTFTFGTLDISGSVQSIRTLTFNWGNRFPSCNGTGWDSQENLVFTPVHNGIPQTPVTIVSGNSNAAFSIQANQYTWSIPTCVSQFSFTLSITTNRADELLFVDNVKLTAPQPDTPLPQPSSISGTTSLCQGATATYSVTQEAGIIYTWSVLPAGASFTTVNGTTVANSIGVNWGTAPQGTYTLTVTPSNACGSTGTPSTISVTILPAPDPVTISGPTSMCGGQTVTLTSSYASGNTWSPGGETTSSITVTAPGTYTVSTVTACGTVTASHTVMLNATIPASITAGGPTSFCPGGSVTLTSGSASGNSWSTGVSTQSISVTTSGTYILTVTDACGTSSASQQVTLLPLPTAQISGTPSFCAGQQTILTASGGDTYQWSTGATTTSITVTAPGNYTVTAFNSCGQVTSAPVTVTELPLPTAQISGTASYCAGEQTILTASGGDTYQWSTGATTTSITLTAPGNYTVTAFNGCGQTTSAPVTVTELPLPTAQISGTASYCAGQQTTLTASGGDTYQWSTGATTTSITVTAAGNYTVTAFNGCGQVTSAPVTVTELPLPNAQIAGPSVVCENNQIQLTASGGTSYQWLSGQATAAITVTTPGTYTVAVTNSCGTDAATKTITQSLLPVAAISGATTFCDGDQVTLTASGDGTYLWSTGQTGASITANAAGTYTVSVTNSCGTDIATATTIVSSVTAGFTVNATTGAAPLPVSFTNTSSADAVTFNWSFGNGATETTFSPSHIYSQSGDYTATLIATNAEGCSDSYSQIIHVLDLPSSLTIPNVFTPNGDHLNDEFIVIAERIESYQLQIMNRWGNVILTTDNPQTGWDGTIQGDQATEGTYFYQVIATGLDKKNYSETGFFVLQR